MCDLFNSDPKGRNPNKPPYIYFHRYEYEEDDTEWMNRIDREIMERRRKREESTGITNSEIDGFITGITVFLITCFEFFILSSIFW